MRTVLGLGVLLAGCSGSPIDGDWSAVDRGLHSLSFGDGRYESGDPDAVGVCREQGTYRLSGADVTLEKTSLGCAVAPKALVWQGDELLRDTLIYRRGKIKLTSQDVPIP